MKPFKKIRDILKRIFYALKKVLPFDDNMEMHTVLFAAKKFLAFCLLYFVLGMVLLEPIVIVVTLLAGYDPLHGIMPDAKSIFGAPLKYMGFFGFMLVTLIYCRVVEKRGLKEMGLKKRPADHLLGGAVAVAMVSAVVLICSAMGIMRFVGINQRLDAGYTVILILGLLIQGAAEEIMCRGFLFKSLLRKTSLPVAIFVSATAFYLPHSFSMEEYAPVYRLMGAVNIYLISVIFSLLLYYRDNLWIACGLHSFWNILLYAVMGLALSGNDAGETGIFVFEVKSANLLFGGDYGLESGLAVTFVLAAAIIGIILLGRGKEQKYGI